MENELESLQFTRLCAGPHFWGADSDIDIGSCCMGLNETTFRILYQLQSILQVINFMIQFHKQYWKFQQESSGIWDRNMDTKFCSMLQMELTLVIHEERTDKQEKDKLRIHWKCVQALQQQSAWEEASQSGHCILPLKIRRQEFVSVF